MEDARMISRGEAERFAELVNTEYFETSAKENRNIEEVWNLKEISERFVFDLCEQILDSFFQVFIALSRLIVNARRAQNQSNGKTKNDGIKINKSKILKKTKKPKCWHSFLVRFRLVTACK